MSVREVAQAPELANELYQVCFDNGTIVQHILYDVNDMSLLEEWLDKGIVPASENSVIFVLDRYTDGQVSHPSDLDPFLQAMEITGRANRR